jgi:arsenate reductase-like glutaredoxin family protein
MLKIYILEYCNYCKQLLDLLNSQNIAYIAIDADECEEQANRLEDFLNVSMYPIVVIEKNGNVTYLVSSDREDTTTLKNIAIVNYLSIQHLFSLIKKFI